MVPLGDTRWRIRRKPFLLFLTFVISSLLIFVFHSHVLSLVIVRQASTSTVIRETMHLAVVSCGRPNYIGVKDFSKPLDLSLTMIKSASMFAKAPLHLHIFTEDEMKDLFVGEIESWPAEVRKRVTQTIYSVDYAEQLPRQLINEWKRWYKPCGSFRLLLPMILKGITDAAIYSDSDVVFIKPIDELWAHLKLMGERQVAAISPTAGHPIGVQESNENFISHPNGHFQINSGVMLMNFTRILEADWRMYHDVGEVDVATAKYGVDLLLPYYKKYKGKAEHDQKLLNIMFHFNPDLLYQLPCSWNFKNNFCTDDGNVCDDAEQNGAGAVHGIAGAFFGESNPTFKGLYQSFLEYKLGDDVEKKLYRLFLANVGRYAAKTYCGKKAHIISDPLKSSISRLDFLPKKEDGELNIH